MTRDWILEIQLNVVLLQELLGGNTDGLLRQIEEWSPRIWHILYVALHMP